MHTRRASARGGHDGGAGPAAPVLLDLPHEPYPAKISVARAVSANSMVSYRGNLYAVPRHLHGHAVEVRRRLGDPLLAIATPRGRVIAQHSLAPDGAGPVGHRPPARDRPGASAPGVEACLPQQDVQSAVRRSARGGRRAATGRPAGGRIRARSPGRPFAGSPRPVLAVDGRSGPAPQGAGRGRRARPFRSRDPPRRASPARPDAVPAKPHHPGVASEPDVTDAAGALRGEVALRRPAC